MVQGDLFSMGTWSLSFKRSTSVRARAISDSLLLDMVISAETFWLQKAGNKPDEYEDAFCPSDRVIGEAGREFSFAIADGATDACFSGTWARQLVNAYCEGMFDPISLAKSLPELQRQWREHVASKGPLPWYVEQKADSGAFATLLGITLEGLAGSVAEGKWRAIAVDSCLFHLRGRQVVEGFPIDQEESFNNSPTLLSSNAGHDEIPLRSVRTMEGKWIGGDTFYLMTDALACWFLRQTRNQRVPWKLLQDVGVGERNKRFEPWIDRLRSSKLVRNDDVTLSRIELHRPGDL